MKTKRILIAIAKTLLSSLALSFGLGLAAFITGLLVISFSTNEATESIGLLVYASLAITGGTFLIGLLIYSLRAEDQILNLEMKELNPSKIKRK